MREKSGLHWTLIFEVLTATYCIATYCIVLAQNKNNLNRHVLLKHEGEVFSCNDCEYKSTSNASIKVQKQTHEESSIIVISLLTKQHKNPASKFT